MLETGFYSLTVLALVMLLAVFRNHPSPATVMLKYAGIILLWTIYLLVLSTTGLLDDFSLPPRVPLLIVLPAVLIILLMTAQKDLQIILKNTSLSLPVFLQSFRILVELLIYAAFLEGIFPERATFEGLNYDIVVGVSALFVGATCVKGKISTKGVLIWNIISLSILAITVYAFISAYYFSDYPLTGKGAMFIEFPYILLASCLLPIAIFLHVFSIRQIQITFKKIYHNT